MQTNGGSLNSGYGCDRFVKFGKSQGKRVDISKVPNPIPDLHYNESILILDANAGIVDLSPNNTVINNLTGLSVVTNPTIIGSKSFDFRSQRLEAAISISANKWTIRTWVYFLSFPSTYDATVFEWNNYTTGLLLRMDSGNTLGIWVEGTAYGVSYPWVANKWYHLEWGYDNGNHYIFVDGKLERTFNRATDIPSSLGIGFTYHSGGGQRMNGYLQYFQVIQGVTAHTENFNLTEVASMNVTEKKIGLHYNPDIPLEALNKRPTYNYQRRDYDLLSLSPLLWLDANDSYTLNLVGSKVALWNDKSGNGYHAIQSSDSSRPSYTTRQEDNLPVVRFSSQSLAISNLVLTGNTFDVFVVASMESSTGNFSRLLTASIAGQSDWNNSSSWVMINRYSSDPTIHSEHSSQRTAQFRVDFGKLYLINPRFTPSNFSFTAETNLIGTTNGTGVLNTTNGVLIGTNTWVGDVSQILIFNRNLSLEERQIVEGYLTEQTNLKSSLPTNHPYKNLALEIKAGAIANIPNWNVKYQRPKARILYEYSLFDVNSLAPLAWYDASDEESITLVDGNRVSRWADKSGNGWDAIENTASARPTYNQYQQNGLPLITCRGSGIGMTTSLNLSTPYSIVLICRQGHAIGRVLQSTSNNCIMAPSRSANAFYVNGTVRSEGIVSLNSFSLTTMVIGGGNSEVWYNNVNYGSGTHGNWGTFTIATRGQFNENPEGEIAEIIIFNRRLSTEDRIKIQEYSLTKWKI